MVVVNTKVLKSLTQEMRMAADKAIDKYPQDFTVNQLAAQVKKLEELTENMR